MKLCSLLSVAILLQINSNVCGDECMSVLQLIAATRILCKEQRHNTILWQQVIDCHKPISDEFMRKSGEAQCPSPKHVQDQTNTDHTIQDVFFNICSIDERSFYNRIRSGVCLLFGKSSPSVMSHTIEVAAVQAQWGKNVPCDIGKLCCTTLSVKREMTRRLIIFFFFVLQKCIMKLDLNLK